MSEYQEKCFTFKKILHEFNEIEGYENLNNEDLANVLQGMKLLGENNNNRENKIHDKEIIADYKKWSFTFSFLQMINAWQWFFAGILLGRNSYLPAQVHQMYYYAIFFSYGSFLSAHFKGNYTVAEIKKSIKVNDKTKENFKSVAEQVKDEIFKASGKNIEISHDYEKYEKVRREVWYVEDKSNTTYIKVKERGNSGGEHERRSHLFHSVFKTWNSPNYFNISYPHIFPLDNSKFFSDQRNFFTYSMEAMADELYYSSDSIDTQIGLSNKAIIGLWQRESSDLANAYPEAFWALEHIKVIVDLHTKLLEGYTNDSPYTKTQVFLLKQLCEHHKNTSLLEVIKVAMPTILQKIEETTSKK